MAEKEEQKKVTIDKVEYNLADFSDNAKNQMQGMSVAITEIKRLDLQGALNGKQVVNIVTLK